MADNMYWISTITYLILSVIILVNDYYTKKQPDRTERSFRLLVGWVIFFCICDTFWGLCFSHVIPGDGAFFMASQLFHTATVITTFFWLNYVLRYLGNMIKRRKLYLIIDGIVILFEITLVTLNFTGPVLFTIRNGNYVTEYYRPLAFLNQYVVYFIIGIVTLIAALKSKEKGQLISRDRYMSVFMFALAPMITGVFQILYPDAPFYSLGYFLGVFIIHIFVISKDREDRLRQSETDLRIQSINDDLTGVLNRRAYDAELNDSIKLGVPDDLVFVSVDVNDLKTVNDNLGHAAGDEIIIGTAACMRDAFGDYGNIYRIGGDEFCAILIANDEQLEQLKKDFHRAIDNWTGVHVPRIFVSVGYGSKNEVEEPSFRKLSILAEERMYQDKAMYYKRRGMDRRGQRDVHAALCTLYIKILKINITEDSYEIINLDDFEVTGIGNVSENISEWFSYFGKSGNVHADDLDEYLRMTNLEFMSDYFKRGNKTLRIFYRRKTKGGYRQAMMEIIPANDYSEDNESLFLYVRDIDR